MRRAERFDSAEGEQEDGMKHDGLFYMVGQEEKKIRSNPGARSTELLQAVFGC